MKRSCLICGQVTQSIVLGRSALQECVGCGYAILDGQRQRRDYWEHSESGEVSDFWVGAKMAYFTAALQSLEKTTTQRRLLDVGGGAGTFSQIAIKRGWDAYSLDISPEATAMAAERLGPERVFRGINEVPNGSFDVATLWCVIAHTLEAHDLVNGVRRTLKNGGLIWLTTPNFRFQKPYARVRAAFRKPIDFIAEDHVGHFTLAALQELLRANNFSFPQQTFVGITETCLAASSDNPSLVAMKRLFNRVAFALSRMGLGNHVSELQVTARASDDYKP